MIQVSKQQIAERVSRLTKDERDAILDADNWPHGGPNTEARLEIGAQSLLMRELEAQRDWQRQEQHHQRANESANAEEIKRLRKQVAALKKTMSLLVDPPKDDPHGAPGIFNMIRSVAWKLINEKRVMRDAGIWTAEKLYGPGAAVTDGGALWVCQKEHDGERPPGDSWRLAVKSDVSGMKRAVADAVRQQLRNELNR